MRTDPARSTAAPVNRRISSPTRKRPTGVPQARSERRRRTGPQSARILPHRHSRPRRISETFPAHELPKEIKHYYAREALSLPKSDPLRHPKLGVSYQKSKWDGKVGLDELDELIYELDQTLHSILNDSELALQDGDGSGLPRDDYFQADDVQYPDDHIISLDLTEIRQEQESIVIRHLADGGFSPVEWESLQPS